VTGLSPKDYITQGLLNKAQQLLLTTRKSISEICIETGFGDQSWFNRQFLAKTKMTPSGFRKKFQREDDL
jgi:AraC-like DNA-binding protein